MNDITDLLNFIIGSLFGFVIGMVCMAYNWNETLVWWKEKIKTDYDQQIKESKKK